MSGQHSSSIPVGQSAQALERRNENDKTFTLINEDNLVISAPILKVRICQDRVFLT